MAIMNVVKYGWKMLMRAKPYHLNFRKKRKTSLSIPVKTLLQDFAECLLMCLKEKTAEIQAIQ